MISKLYGFSFLHIGIDLGSDSIDPEPRILVPWTLLSKICKTYSDGSNIHGKACA